MLDHLERIQIKSPVVPKNDFDKIDNAVWELVHREDFNDDFLAVRPQFKSKSGKVFTLSGISEDWKVVCDGKTVFEFVFDQISAPTDMGLAKEFLGIE